MNNTVLLYILVIAIGFALTALFTKIEIPILHRHQLGQYIREEGPKSHLAKQGTPTMGGIAIFGGIALSAAIGSVIIPSDGFDVFMILFAGFLFGMIGFLDDFIKVVKKHNLGLRVWQKLVLQILFSVLLALYVEHGTNLGTDIWVPVAGDVDFHWFFLPFVVFVMVAMTNAVNLTDGLDGLCSSVTAVVALFFLVISLMAEASPSGICCAAILGGCLGFLVYNHHPAKIFMGDTGSLALGALVTAAVAMMKTELLIPFAGVIYVMEAGSVIIQVGYFKKTGGKRFFRMAPIHHHFELGGRSEVQVVRLFVTISLIGCAAAFLLYRFL